MPILLQGNPYSGLEIGQRFTLTFLSKCATLCSIMSGRPRLHRPFSICHPDKEAYNATGGLCERCYKREWARNKRKLNPPTPKLITIRMADCHPSKRHWGKGLCLACYHRKYRKAKPEIVKRAVQKWRNNNPDKIYNRHLRNRYGITIEEFKERLARQNNLCKLCNKELTDKTAVVDHCHITDKIRGIVHQGCNMIIGWFENSLPYKEQVERYLREGNSEQ